MSTFNETFNADLLNVKINFESVMLMCEVDEYKLPNLLQAHGENCELHWKGFQKNMNYTAKTETDQ